MTNTAHDHYEAAIALRSRILAGQSNELPVQAWAGVVRECAIASNKKRNEIGNQSYTRAELSFFNMVERVRFYARAQVEALAGRA